MRPNIAENAIDEFIALVKAGAEEAGPYLVSMCGARLVGYIRQIAPDLSQADHEDICDMSIERAIRNIEDFESERASFDGWVRGYARYVVLEHRRRIPVTTTDPGDLPERGDQQVAEEPSAVSPLVAGAVSQLPDTDQMIIRLRDYELLDYDAIARMLNVDSAACRKRHQRALARLKSKLEAIPGFTEEVLRSES
jgi:RNA polymerase sigma factor (sigma-70 family)